MCGLPPSADFVSVADPFRGYGPYVQVPGEQRYAALVVGATCMFYLQQMDDQDKLRAIVLEMATDLTHNR